MHFIRPEWLKHTGEKKDHEVYSCHVSPDGARLVTAAGGRSQLLLTDPYKKLPPLIIHIRLSCPSLVYRCDLQCWRSGAWRTQTVGVDELSYRHNPCCKILFQWKVSGFRSGRQGRLCIFARSKPPTSCSYIWYVVWRISSRHGKMLITSLRINRTATYRELAYTQETCWSRKRCSGPWMVLRFLYPSFGGTRFQDCCVVRT